MTNQINIQPDKETAENILKINILNDIVRFELFSVKGNILTIIKEAKITHVLGKTRGLLALRRL